MQRRNLAIPVKLWALACVILGISLTSNTILTCVLAFAGFAYLAAQRSWRLLRSFGVFYGLLAALLYLIRFYGLHMTVFSEFYVLMFWNLSPVFIIGWDLIATPPGEIAAFLSRIHMPTSVILGLLVMFRFFPTMRAELKSVGRSMSNRGLTAPAQLFGHPAASCEYVAVPMLLRCLQIADQLSVSAVARGAEAPGKRSSYYGRNMDAADWFWLVGWTIVTAVFLWLGGVRI
ncbi:MAG: energy-coupling factor transporter transmembrane component T [Bacillota bacterium]|nr:energy-coupling factor transporter transmembrane component T [Bacillota bacterium]